MYTSINHNLMAGNTARNLNTHYGNLATSTQRLSSGLRINSAADDAAGLAIRELMRADIAAMNQGVRNANDAISMLQVADGALAIIDEKLIRMKELAEQAATGTYDSTQRLMIDSEFQAMAAEIDRIANATDFNGIKLLDGSLSGAHDGSGLNAKGRMKIHFGAENDSAEDYYYVEIGDCSTKGLGLWRQIAVASDSHPGNSGHNPVTIIEKAYADLGFGPSFDKLNDPAINRVYVDNPPAIFSILDAPQDTWYLLGIGVYGIQNTMLLIPSGTKNVVLNEIGGTYGSIGDNDIQLFTRDGKHLAGRFPMPDYSHLPLAANFCKLETVCREMGFTIDQYDASYVNSGPGTYDDGRTMAITSYNGMNIAYSGEGPEVYDFINRYEILAIDNVTEDLIVWLPGNYGSVFKYYANGPSTSVHPAQPIPPAQSPEDLSIISIETQKKAQECLVAIDEAIIKKDKIRAHLGALQNRLENTVSNLTIQAENLQTAESRISDADVATEMTIFVRNQILTQSAVSMLSQANSMPQMAMQLIGG